MRDLDQTIIKFDYDKNLKTDDFFLSKSNKHVFDFLNTWPKWERNFVNVIGEKLSGKTHLMNIFLHKNKGIKFEGKTLENNDLKRIKIHENIVIENLSDRQISLDDKFIEFIIKRIERSYSKIYDFIYKIDQLSLKKKKSIDLKIIKEVLGE